MIGPTPEHEQQVRQLGFATLQGWHYSEALPLTDCLDDWNAQQQSR